MNDRIRTLLLEANGTHWTAVVVDTVGQGLLTARENTPSWIARSRTLRKLFGDRYAEASYITDWRDAFCESDALSIERCNITNLLEFRARRHDIRTFDLTIVLHSALGDRTALLNRVAHWFHDRRGKLAVFVGNEYDLMEEKISFINQSGADYVCSQLPIETARKLYEGCRAAILPMPHALNPSVYRVLPDQPRSIDIGFVGDLYDRLIGDQERTRIVDFVAREGPKYGLRCDVRRQRMPRSDWARFLNSCHGIVGAESGTYFLQKSGEALGCAKALVKSQPGISFDAVYRKCFAAAGPTLNGKAISSRHFEPIGTKTCQLLVEGAYNGILEADRHYIAVKPDLSNIDRAVRRFNDPACRADVTAAAYGHVMDGHTYRHRVRQFVDIVATKSSQAASAPS
jgi:hypothetical protein